MQPRILAGLITLGVFAVVVLGFRPGGQQTAATEQAKTLVADRPVAMPANLTAVVMTLGLKDQEPTFWEGTVSLSAGKLLSTDVVLANPKATTKDGTFKVRSIAAPKQPKQQDPMIRPTLRLTLDAPPTTRVTVTTKQGTWEFALDKLSADSAQTFLQDQVSVLLEEGAMRLTGGEVESDYPAMARAADGTLWLAYCEYHKGKPYITERVVAGDFDALVPTGNGDRIRLKHYDGKTWSAAIDVTEPGLDIWRPTVTVAGGRVHVSWSQQVNGKWDIYHRVYSPPAKPGAEGKWSGIVQVTAGPRANLSVVSTATSTGQVWLAWQTRDGAHFQIEATRLEFREQGGNLELVHPVPMRLTRAKANHWSPAIAADSTGRVYVGYDTYAGGDYDVRVDEVSGSGTRTFNVTSSALFEARPNLVCDKQDRLWIAYEEGDEQWGKDYSTDAFKKIGFTRNPGSALYGKRTVRVKCLQGGKIMQPAGELAKAMLARTANNKTMPRLALDPKGGLWLLYRHHPRPFGIGEVWNSFAVHYNGQDWSTPRRLGQSSNLMDNRPALAPLGEGVMAVFSGDGRSKQQDRRVNDLFAMVLTSPGPTRVLEAVADGPIAPAVLQAVHPGEAADIARMRGYRLDYQGKKLHLIRGEFHRHTEYTAHRDQDGLLEDSWRYALDAANLDWLGNADHDNGHHDEYSWWQIQKMADMMHNPPEFIAVQSYERSVKYPDGHRNVILPKRGIRPLPRGNLMGTEEQGTPDTKILYRYLKHFGGICSSHTSATDMGTDWRDNDPVFEPVVEIYQGHRHNYEFFGAPRSATKETQIGGYEPKGFINHALEKGYRLGFQASSDHVSTHMSYGIVLTEDVSRQGIIDAFKRRHSYAATDNIVLEFRCDKYMMGDIFETTQAPAFTIKVLGTAPVAKVSILRDGKDVRVEEPKKQEVTLTYTDMDAPIGKTSYYYVRIEQSDGNLAWASPMWITYKAR
jgi:hypothetical protein